MRGVMKIGGSVVGEDRPRWLDELAARLTANDRVLVVHGGGRLISQELDRLGEPVTFIEGQRVTTSRALEVVLSVLKGKVNGELIAYLEQHGVPAIGISGIDRSLLTARPHLSQLGRVGTVEAVHPGLIEGLWSLGLVPVVAPLAADGSGGILNVNGDTAAGALASALGADYLIFYTDAGGVRRVADDPETRVARLTTAEGLTLIDQGHASEGMIPKIRSGVAALAQGVQRVAIGGYAQGTELVREGGDACAGR